MYNDTSRTTFQHELLPDPGKYIRLLKIQEGNIDQLDQPVECTVATFKFDTTPVYHAI